MGGGWSLSCATRKPLPFLPPPKEDAGGKGGESHRDHHAYSTDPAFLPSVLIVVEAVRGIIGPIEGAKREYGSYRGKPDLVRPGR